MIPKETIDKIFEEARIEEVVGDFVSLKKKGANLLGHCPFHNEKTPSFTVSPAKGIYKCFGCGAAGNSVNFLMQLEQLSYPEALKQLAKKYNIEIVEDELTEEQQQQMDEREQLFLVSQLASDYYRDNLTTSEGKMIGLSYFKERGISDEMMERFGLGYSFDQRDAFSKFAKEKGYKEEVLSSAGLSIQKEGRPPIDRFYGRVIFPIHSITGRVLGFGARTLKTDKKVAKYLNSPETPIYHKSKVLYGVYQSKRRIIQDDNCFLVEGYTDVISLHQKGIENVVASSGTSLTEEQIRLIKRFTPNITVLFDGDAAGIKASFRGIDMLLKEDMNVKVVLFPDGEDPDSFARKNNTFDLENYLKDNAQDFIGFKCSVLMEDAGDDPFKRAELIKDVVNSIALISDNIVRSVYVKEAAKLLSIEENTLFNELQGIRQSKKSTPRSYSSGGDIPPDFPPPVPDFYQVPEYQEDLDEKDKIDHEEKELVRLMLLYGHEFLLFNLETEEEEATEDEPETHEVSVAQFILNDIDGEGLSLKNPSLKKIMDEYRENIAEGEVPTHRYFIQHQDPEVVKLAVELSNDNYTLSENWKRHQIFVTTEREQLKMAIAVACNRFKMVVINREIEDIQTRIKADAYQEGQEHTMDDDLLNMNKLLAIKKVISGFLGRV